MVLFDKISKRKQKGRCHQSQYCQPGNFTLSCFRSLFSIKFFLFFFFHSLYFSLYTKITYLVKKKIIVWVKIFAIWITLKKKHTCWKTALLFQLVKNSQVGSCTLPGPTAVFVTWCWLHHNCHHSNINISIIVAILSFSNIIVLIIAIVCYTCPHCHQCNR